MINYQSNTWTTDSQIKANQIQNLEDTIEELEADQGWKWSRDRITLNFFDSNRSMFHIPSRILNQGPNLKFERIDNKISSPEIQLEFSEIGEGSSYDQIFQGKLKGQNILTKFINLGALLEAGNSVSDFTIYTDPVLIGNQLIGFGYKPNIGRCLVLSDLFSGELSFFEFTSFPISATGITAELLDNYIYFFGGKMGAPPTDAAYRFNLTKKRFETLEPIPSTLSDTCSLIIGDEIWLVGGQDTENSRINKIFIYNTQENSWESLEIPFYRSNGGAIEFDRKIFYFGGIDQSNNTSGDIITFDLDSFDSNLSWGSLIYPTADFGYARSKDRAILIGGPPASNVLQVYSLQDPNEKFSQLTDPTAMVYGRKLKLWNSLFVGLGKLDFFNVANFWSSDFGDGQFRELVLKNIPSSIGEEFIKTCQHGNVTYLFGGITSGSPKSGMAAYYWRTNELESLTSYPDLTNSTFSSECNLYDNTIYIFGNNNSKAYLYSIPDQSWEIKNTQFSVNQFYTSVIIDHYIYILGVNGNDQLFKRIDLELIDSSSGVDLTPAPEALNLGDSIRWMDQIILANQNNLLSYNIKNDTWSYLATYSDSPPRFENAKMRQLGELICIAAQNKIFFFSPANNSIQSLLRSPLLINKKYGIEIMNGDLYRFSDGEIGQIQIPNTYTFEVEMGGG